MKSLILLLTPALCFAQFTSVTCAGDGSTDVTSCINTILSANDLVFFPTPSVCYKISGSLNLHGGQTIMGGKRPASGVGGICSYSTTADVLFASYGTSGTRYITIYNMYIYDAVKSMRTTGAAIHIDGGSSDAAIIDVHDTYSYGFQDGLWISSTVASNVARNRFDLPLRDGVYQSLASTSTGFYNNYVDQPGQYCYYITAMSYSTFDSNACDNSGSDGYHFDTLNTYAIRAIVLNGDGAESPTGNAMYLDGQSFNVNAPNLVGIPTGTGKAGILVIGSNIQIASAYISGGDYGVSLPDYPAHGGAPASVVVTNSYFWSQGISQYYDPHHAIQEPILYFSRPRDTRP